MLEAGRREDEATGVDWFVIPRGWLTWDVDGATLVLSGDLNGLWRLEFEAESDSRELFLQL